MRRIRIIFIVILIVSIVMGIYHDICKRRSSQDFVEALQLSGLVRSSHSTVGIQKHDTTLDSINLCTLQDINEDVIGWITIPDTQVSYPVVQSDDNQFYLTHNWKREYSTVGSIFLDSNNSGDMCDFNVVIYGHRMRDNSMFGSLKYYSESSYLKQHPSVYLSDGERTRRYDVFAVYESDLSDMVSCSELTNDNWGEVIQNIMQKSEIDTGVTPNEYTQLLTLVTCSDSSYNTRWVVYAALEQ